MPFLERIETNFPLVLAPAFEQLQLDSREYSRALESSQSLVDDSDAVAISESFSSLTVDTPQSLSIQLSPAELESLFEDMTLSDGTSSFLDLQPLDTYRIMDRIHRLPLYGTFIVDVYV